MGRRRMLPSRDPPEPRRGFAAFGVYGAERRIRGGFQQPRSGERPVECLA
jgi:hypothetical protein